MCRPPRVPSCEQEPYWAARGMQDLLSHAHVAPSEMLGRPTACGLSPPKGVDACMSLGNKGLAFPHAWVRASWGGRPPAFKPRNRPEAGAVRAEFCSPGMALPGRGQDRATQPLCTSGSAAPHAGTRWEGEAVAVLFKVEQRYLLFFLEMQHSDSP